MVSLCPKKSLFLASCAVAATALHTHTHHAPAAGGVRAVRLARSAGENVETKEGKTARKIITLNHPSGENVKTKEGRTADRVIAKFEKENRDKGMTCEIFRFGEEEPLDGDDKLSAEHEYFILPKEKPRRARRHRGTRRRRNGADYVDTRCMHEQAGEACFCSFGEEDSQKSESEPASSDEGDSPSNREQERRTARRRTTARRGGARRARAEQAAAEGAAAARKIQGAMLKARAQRREREEAAAEEAAAAKAAAEKAAAEEARQQSRKLATSEAGERRRRLRQTKAKKAQAERNAEQEMIDLAAAEKKQRLAEKAAAKKAAAVAGHRHALLATQQEGEKSEKKESASREEGEDSDSDEFFTPKESASCEEAEDSDERAACAGGEESEKKEGEESEEWPEEGMPDNCMENATHQTRGHWRLHKFTENGRRVQKWEMSPEFRGQICQCRDCKADRKFIADARSAGKTQAEREADWKRWNTTGSAVRNGLMKLGKAHAAPVVAAQWSGL